MNKLLKTITVMAFAAGLSSAAFGQTLVFSDDFTASQGEIFTTDGQIGTSAWNVTRSGDDWGARIDGGIMTLTNTASATANVNGWVFANRTLTSSGDFNTTLSDSAGLVSWSFNMQQIRPNPAGFGGNAYGAAFVLGATSQSLASAGNGYAIVLGNTGTPDPIRLVSFTDGIHSLGTTTGGIITASAPLNDPKASHMSILVTYNPSNNEWSLFGRNDEASFADPLAGTLTALGSATDATYTNTALGFSGAYWQGSTAGSQTATFDNVTLSVVPEPATSAAIFGVLALGLVVVRRRLRR